MRNIDALLAAADRQAKQDLAVALRQPSQKIYNLVTQLDNALRHNETPAGQRKLWSEQTMEEGW